jgi:hypothetical protein
MPPIEPTQEDDPMMAALSAAPTAQPQGEAPAPTSAGAPLPDNAAIIPGGPQGPGIYPDQEQGLKDPTSFMDAAVGGAANALFQTKDFLFGKGAKSETRQAVEKGTEAVTKDDMFNGFVSSVSQFAVGMLGAGKIQAGLSMIPKVGAAIGGLSTTGETVLSSAKAAMVGAAAFDPHGERLSNLVESVPALSNPVTSFLESKPGDSDAMGRVKSALESIGMDAVAIGLFSASTRLYKAIKSGDKAEVEAASKEVQNAIEVKTQAETGTAANDNGALPTNGQDAAVKVTTGELPSAKDANTGAPAELPKAANNQGESWADGPPAGKFSDMTTGDLAVEADHAGATNDVPAGTSQKWDFISGLDEHTKERLWNLPEAEKKVELDKAVEEAAREGYHVDPLPDDMRVSKWNGTNWEAAGLDHVPTTDAVDRIAVLLYNKTMGRTIPLAEFKAKFAKAREGLPDPHLPAGSAEVTQVANATEAGAPKTGPKPVVDDETLTKLIDAVGQDADAMVTASSWNNAVAQGHTFGGGVNIPWQKIVQDGGQTSTAIQAMTDRVAAALEKDLAKMKGGEVLPDARVNRMIGQRMKLWGEDPAALMGTLQAAGNDAKTMAANMEASYIVAQRSMQDSFTMAARISAGDLTQFGGTGRRRRRPSSKWWRLPRRPTVPLSPCGRVRAGPCAGCVLSSKYRQTSLRSSRA